MPVVPPYYLTQIWCLWSPLTIWPNLMPVGPPLNHLNQMLTPCGPPLTYLTQIWCPSGPPLPFDTKCDSLCPPPTIWPKFDACGSRPSLWESQWSFLYLLALWSYIIALMTALWFSHTSLKTYYAGYIIRLIEAILIPLPLTHIIWCLWVCTHPPPPLPFEQIWCLWSRAS